MSKPTRAFLDRRVRVVSFEVTHTRNYTISINTRCYRWSWNLWNRRSLQKVGRCAENERHTMVLSRRSCEITLELMRQYADTLITIIEVFLYDPLYQWQLSPQKALQLQQQFDKSNNDSIAPASHHSSGKGSMLPSTPSASSANVGGESVTTGRMKGRVSILHVSILSSDTNKMAERLLLGLRQKLQGVERLNQMTIKAHVNMLIQEATSIDNLSQLFAGWQPYL